MEISIALLVVYIILSFAILGLWISALISAASTAKNKVLWVLIVFVFGGIGALAWFLFGEREPKKKISYGPRRRLRGGASAGGSALRRGVRPGTGTKIARRPLRR